MGEAAQRKEPALSASHPGMSSEAEQLAQARKRFEEFHERAPRGANDIVKIGGLVVPTLGLAVGRFSAITYQAVGDGHVYTHEFNRNCRPLIFVNSDGRQIYILEGGYRFTSRGFIG
jgi:hypothetical protein